MSDTVNIFKENKAEMFWPCGKEVLLKWQVFFLKKENIDMCHYITIFKWLNKINDKWCTAEITCILLLAILWYYWKYGMTLP